MSNSTRRRTTPTIFHGHVIAESDQTQIVEGNHYFPAFAASWVLHPDEDEEICPWICPWKGVASY